MSQFHSDCRRTKSVSWQICLNVAYIKHISSLSLDFSHSSKRRWEIEVFQLSRAYHANKDVFASVILVHEEIIFAILVDVGHPEGRGWRCVQEQFVKDWNHAHHRGKSIKEIASDLGFSSEFNFSRFIKQHCGQAPSKLRRANTSPLYIRK